MSRPRGKSQPRAQQQAGGGGGGGGVEAVVGDNLRDAQKLLADLQRTAQNAPGNPLKHDMLRAVGVGRTLLSNMGVIATELSLTIENSHNVTLSLEVANMQIALLTKKTKQLEAECDRLRAQLRDRERNPPVEQEANGNGNGNDNDEILAPTALHTDADVERAVDDLVDRHVQRLAKRAANPIDISKHVEKVGANVYRVCGHALHMGVHQRVLMVRVGGGFEAFPVWCDKHQSLLERHVNNRGNSRQSVLDSRPRAMSSFEVLNQKRQDIIHRYKHDLSAMNSSMEAEKRRQQQLMKERLESRQLLRSSRESESEAERAAHPTPFSPEIEEGDNEEEGEWEQQQDGEEEEQEEGGAEWEQQGEPEDEAPRKAGSNRRGSVPRARYQDDLDGVALDEESQVVVEHYKKQNSVYQRKLERARYEMARLRRERDQAMRQLQVHNKAGHVGHAST